MSRNMTVDAARIGEDIAALARITEEGHPYTRRAFSPLYMKGRTYIEARMQAAGLETRIDAGGNLIGLRKGRRREAGAIMLGSHSDTVPGGGRFDGVAGVVAALEVARALADHDIHLDHDLEIVDFLAEEVSIFGVSCIGSRAMTGQLPKDWLERSAGGQTLHQAMAATGGDVDALARDVRADIAGFLELHIEQGPVLEREGKDIGVVTAIAGITRIAVTVEGRADHAGTTPMTGRADALAAAAQLVLDIRETAMGLSRRPSHFTATVGEFRVEPNAANVVPSRVTLLIDARAEIRDDMQTFRHWLQGAAARIAGDYHVTIPPPATVSDNPPAPCHPALLDILDKAADDAGARHRRMASGAGHDTAWISRVAPAAMIFVPCQDGRSHCPDEWAETGDIALGAAVLAGTVIAMDTMLPTLQEDSDGTHTR